MTTAVTAGFGSYRGIVLAALVVISVVSSHAPGKLRYLVLLGGGRITGSDSRG